MSGLAMVLAQRGYSVSGSDTTDNIFIKKLKALNVEIFNNQKAININLITKNQTKDVLIIVSSAISEMNE